MFEQLKNIFGKDAVKAIASRLFEVTVDGVTLSVRFGLYGSVNVTRPDGATFSYGDAYVFADDVHMIGEIWENYDEWTPEEREALSWQ